MVMIVRILVEDVDTKKFDIMFRWCLDNFGEFREQWNYRIMDGIWEFKKSDDATLFALRWS
jgi:hypothetical protein